MIDMIVTLLAHINECFVLKMERVTHFNGIIEKIPDPTCATYSKYTSITLTLKPVNNVSL